MVDNSQKGEKGRKEQKEKEPVGLLHCMHESARAMHGQKSATWIHVQEVLLVKQLVSLQTKWETKCPLMNSFIHYFIVKVRHTRWHLARVHAWKCRHGGARRGSVFTSRIRKWGTQNTVRSTEEEESRSISV